jgi:hypothetical protein
MLISDFFRVTPEKPLFFGSDNLCILQQEHQRIHPCKEPDCPARNRICCRKCIQKWPGIEKGRALNEAEIDYIVALIMGWIEYKTKKVSTRKP